MSLKLVRWFYNTPQKARHHPSGDPPEKQDETDVGAMKKWIIIVAFSALCAATIPFLKIDITSNRQVIYIKGGETVLADSVRQSDQFVFYEAGGKSAMLM